MLARREREKKPTWRRRRRKREWQNNETERTTTSYPKTKHVRESKLLRKEQHDPTEGVEPRIDLQIRLQNTWSKVRTLEFRMDRGMNRYKLKDGRTGGWKGWMCRWEGGGWMHENASLPCCCEHTHIHTLTHTRTHTYIQRPAPRPHTSWQRPSDNHSFTALTRLCHTAGSHAFNTSFSSSEKIRRTTDQHLTTRRGIKVNFHYH